jgi:hypothetical protein
MLNTLMWVAILGVIIWENIKRNKESSAKTAAARPIEPGLYKAKYAKNTIIEAIDEYNYDGDVRISLREGGNLSEDENGLGLMGLMPDVAGKKRYYPREALRQYFSPVVVNEKN